MHFTGCPPIFRRIFGRQRDFFDSNVWRLQVRKNEKSVISLSTFFCRDSKVRKSGARTSAPRVVVGVVEEGGRGGGGRWSGWWRKVVKWRTWSKMERTFVCFAKQNTHHKLIFSFCGAKARKPWMSTWTTEENQKKANKTRAQEGQAMDHQLELEP